MEIKIQSNRHLTKDIKERMKRANVVMKQVWWIGERKLKDGFKNKMIKFDYFIVGVMLYGSNFSGRKREKNVEEYIRYIEDGV